MPKRTRGSAALATAKGACWLMKSEPDAFSIDDLRKMKISPWDGVRNYQARNIMREMKVGDQVLFYHSNAKPPGVIGLARVVRQAYPDHTARDAKSKYFDAKASEEKPIWDMVDVEFVAKFDAIIPLVTLRRESALKDMILLSRGRLSVQPVKADEYNHILAMASASGE
jgi:predicted RNA-binding protein with PUA-like domain